MGRRSRCNASHQIIVAWRVPDFSVIIVRMEMRIITIVLSLLVFCAVVGTVAEGYRERPSSESAMTGAQDAVYLDRRISMLETRLNSIESSIRTLEQQAIMSRSSPAQPTRDAETMLLRSEVEILRSRLRELECGLAHLDERTLSATAKEARKRTAAQSTDPCRLNPEIPVQLSPRR